MPRVGHPSRAYLLIVHAEDARALQRLPGVGPAAAEDLLLLGIRRAEDLVGRDAGELYATLCHLDGRRHPPRLRDRLAALVACAATLGGKRSLKSTSMA